MRNRFAFSLGIGLAVVLSTTQILTAAAPKNVILFIGDGMGFEHVKAARYYNGGPLSFEGLPAQAQVTTYSANNAITDSAAAGTAIATGQKVNNYVVSKALPGDGSDLPTSLERFRDAGKKTGLITTTYLTHATPAAFGAHVTDRNSTTDVATDYLKAEGGSRPNILFGGGGYGLTPESTTAAGYDVATDKEGFNALDLTTTSPLISAQFGSTYLPYEFDYLGKTYPFPHLSEMVSKALAEIGDDPTGFFLMVEGGKIDQAAHANDRTNVVHETLEFSRAVQVALTWAASRTDTLILVTADHETGGLSVTRDNGAGKLPDVTWSSTGHTGANVPAYAWGVDAQRVTGILDNTDIYKICMGEVAPVTATLVAKGSTWKYEATGTDLGTGWRATTYDDSGWPSGPAELGYGDGGEETLVPKTSPVYPCYYFRHHFNVESAAAYSDLKLAILRDDGAVVYLNGLEVARYSMTTGDITYGSWATTAADYAWDPAVSIPNLLVDGANVLAVEIHQCNSTSSDISLDLELTATVRDTTAPLISGLAATPSDVSARITWSTDEDADSVVSVSGTSGSFVVEDTTLTRAHNVLLQGLVRNTTYNYVASSMDSSGNWASAEGTFTTKSNNTPPEATPPTEAIVLAEDSYSGTINLTGSDADDDPLTVTITTPPQHGTLSEDVPIVVYTPAPNWFGDDSFQYIVSDGSLESSPATVSLTVKPVNDAPVANPDSAMVLEGYSVRIPVLANDTDIDGPSALRVTSASLVSSVGEIVVNPDDTVTFRATAGSVGTQTFTYTVTDGQVTSTGTVTVTVRPNTLFSDGFESGNFTAGAWTVSGSATVTTTTKASGNYAAQIKRVGSITRKISAIPSSRVDLYYSYTTAGLTSEDAVVEVLSDNNTWVLVQKIGPVSGWQTDGLASFTVAPGSDFSVRFRLASDSNKKLFLVDDVKVVIPAPSNLAPEAFPDNYSTDEDTVLTVADPGVLANDTDGEGQSLTAKLVSAPSSGTLVLNSDGSFTYTPVANWNGTASFTYAATDGTADSTPATVTITVNLVNDPPVANAATVTTPEDTAVGITLTGSDVDGDVLSYTYIEPLNGTLSGETPNLTYTPNANFNGNDSFTFTVSDGTATASGTISINVTAVNDVPVATAQSVAVDEDAPKTITLGGTDVDSTELKYTVVDGPAKGTLTGTAPNLTYTPAANFNGSDSFVYTVSDGSLSASATISITINAVNDAPVAESDTYTMDQGTTLTIAAPGVLANDSDVDGDNLTVEVLKLPANGAISLAPSGSFTYTPNSGDTGTDSFSYTVSDNNGGTATGTVTITIAEVNDPPAAVRDAYSTSEDTTLTVDAPGVLSNDSDLEGQTITAVLMGGPANGTLTLNVDGSFSYTPAANFNGTDSFTYKASDGVKASDVATVTITVTPVNDAPVADSLSVSVPEDGSVQIALSGSDVEGSTLTFAVVDGPAYGKYENGTYTPAANYNGADSFTYKANDGEADSPLATVSITVEAVNDAPEATAQAVTVDEDGSLAITLTGADVDGGTLSYSVGSGPANGTLSGEAPNLTYTPDANFNGSDSFTYTVSDGTADSASATISITVNAVNDAPVAGDDSFSTIEGTSLVLYTTELLANDTDVDKDVLSVVLPTDPVNGSLISNQDGSFTYTPDGSFNGTDTFTYEVYDGTVTAIGQVTITVAPAVTIKTMTSTIEMAKVVIGKNWRATAKVTMDSEAGLVPGVTVTGDWYYNGALVSEAASLMTDASGAVTFTSPNYKSSTGATLTFVVTSATLQGYTYDAGNSETSDSVTY